MRFFIKLFVFLVYFEIAQVEFSNAQRRTFNPGCIPYKVKNGRSRLRGRVFAQYSCNKGYLLAGDRYSKCSQGQWDSPPPMCVRPTCQKPQSIKDAIIHPSHRGGVLNFYCRPDFKLQGPKQAFCVDMKWSTHMPSCIPSTVIPSLSCDFETEDICGWTHDLNHNFDWLRLNKRTPSGHLATGPSFDHTKGRGEDGYYMYIEGSTQNINDTARLISPVYKRETNNTCLEFYYHMYGAGIGELRVYMKKVNDSWVFKLQDAIFARDGNQGNEWWRGLVELGPITDEFQIIFEGIRGISFTTDIAIDDVKIIENCVIDSTTTTEMDLPESTFVYDSCVNKCNTTTTADMSCRCDENCYENNTCCPDYVAVCVLGNDTDTTSTTDQESTTIEDNETTFPPITVLPTQQTIAILTLPTLSSIKTTQAITTTKPFGLKTTAITLSSTKPTMKPMTKLPIIIRKPTISTSTSTTQAPVVVTTTTGWIYKAFTLSTAPPLLPPPPPQPLPPVSTTQDAIVEEPNKTTTHHYYKNDMLTVPIEIATEDDSNVIGPIKEEPIIPKDYPSGHPILSDKVAPVHEKPAPSNKITVIAVLTVCFIVIGILSLIFLIKRYTRSWMSVKRMRSGNGDSQSDVRFLTHDEILDFRIAQPASDY
ncbi:putative somatomedin B [Trypoxylus dichotomus]